MNYWLQYENFPNYKYIFASWYKLHAYFKSTMFSNAHCHDSLDVFQSMSRNTCNVKTHLRFNSLRFLWQNIPLKFTFNFSDRLKSCNEWWGHLLKHTCNDACFWMEMQFLNENTVKLKIQLQCTILCLKYSFNNHPYSFNNHPFNNNLQAFKLKLAF